jgi:hypothetical protein
MVSGAEFGSPDLAGLSISYDSLHPLRPLSSRIRLTIASNIPFSISLPLRSNWLSKNAGSAPYQPEERLSNLAISGMEMSQ